MAAFEVEEMKQILAGAINRLGDREKIVLSLYYYEGLTLAEIGQVLGVTESRVCQIHTKAVLQLRARMLVAGQRDCLTGQATLGRSSRTIPGPRSRRLAARRGPWRACSLVVRSR